MLKFHEQNGQPRAVPPKRKAFTDLNDDVEDGGENAPYEERPAKRMSPKDKKSPFESPFAQSSDYCTDTPTPGLPSPMEIDEHFFAPITTIAPIDESGGSDDELCQFMENVTISSDQHLLDALLDRPCAPVASLIPPTRSFSAIPADYESGNETDNEATHLSGEAMEY
jgi:hypothetical protein